MPVLYYNVVVFFYFFFADVGWWEFGRETDDNKGTRDVARGQEEETRRGYGFCFITSFYYR